MIKKYIRNKKGNPRGVLIAFWDPELKFARIGWSLCCKRDTFTKERAMDIAINRCYHWKREIPHSIAAEFKEFEQRCEKYFQKHLS